MSPKRWVDPLTLNRGDGAGHTRVLQVDDDRDVAEVSAKFLERSVEDLEVVVETSAGEALDRLEDEQVDCIISDYEMPGMDGLEFLDAVRQDHPELPFVLFTGKGSEEIASEAISRGVTDYLQKGTGAEQYELLANRIENVVDQARIRAERDRAHARFKALTENASFAVLTIDEESRIHYVNDAIVDILGYEPEELLGESLLTVMPERYHEAHLAGIERYVEEGTRNLDWSWVEFSALHAEGHEVPLGISFNEMERERGRLFTAIIRDITEQKERERELERYETLLETVTDGVYALDTDGRYTYVNSWIEDNSGYDREELVGAEPTKLLSEGAVERFEDGIEEMLAGERETFATELEFRTADGETVPAEAKITTLTDDGTFEGTVGVVRDVSERKEREQALREEKALTESILDAQPDVFYLFDEEGQFIRWNDRFAEVTGYDDEQIAEMGPLDFIPDEDEELIADAIACVFDGEKAVVESALVTADGERIPHEFTGALVTDGEEVIGLAGIGRDVSERKEHERELAEQNERLEEFASVVSHDLKGPLGVARGRLTLAAAEHDSEDLQKAADALERMERLVDNLLDLAVEGQQVDDPEPVRLEDVIEDSWVRVSRGESGTLRSSVGDAAVLADRDRLGQVFENLFQNAVEHGSTGPPSQAPEDAVEHAVSDEPSLADAREDAVEHGSTSPPSQAPENAVEHGSASSRATPDDALEDGSTTPEADVTVRLGLLEDRDGFYVADDGPGVPEGDREEVFERGYTTSDDGTGFGLAIVRSIVESHGWRIEVTESESGGARFEISDVSFEDAG